MAVLVRQKGPSFSLTIGGVMFDAYDFFTNYGGIRMGMRRRAVHTEAVEQRAEGENALGAWTEEVIRIKQAADFIPEQNIVVKHYAETDVAVLHMENTCDKPLFDTDVVSALHFVTPTGGKGYITHIDTHEFAQVPPGHYFSTSTFSDDFPKGYGDLDWGNFAFFDAGKGRYGVFLPIIGSGMSSRISVADDTIGFISTGLDGTKIYNRIPLGIVATGRDPYQLVKDVFRAAQEATDHAFALRKEKPFPEQFEYFGWCSWNAFGHSVSSEKVLKMAERVREENVPIHMFLIDDGWQQVEKRKMTGFGANEKFPEGIADLTWRLRQDYDIKHIGMWHAFEGYWKGVDASADDFAGNSQWLWYGTNGQYLPNPLEEQGKHFMAHWYNLLRSWGVDFVKVDNQGDFRGYFYNLLPQDEAMGKMQANLQNAAAEADLPIINCMGQHPECYYHYYRSSVARTNTDFFPEEDEPSPQTLDYARRHLQDSLFNSFWFQEIVYPDYDMFQTHHRAAKCFAALNAISAGPLYTTDMPERMDVGLVRKLMNDDGRILRPDAPARPCLECLTAEPYEGEAALSAFAPVGDGCILTVINNGPALKKIDYAITLKGLQMPSAPRYAVYSHFAGSAHTATARQNIEGTLDWMGVESYTIVPVQQRFAAFGFVDRFVSSAAIDQIEREGGEITIKLTGTGMFGAYVAGGVKAVQCGGQQAEAAEKAIEPGQYKVKNNLLLVNTPSREITISV